MEPGRKIISSFKLASVVLIVFFVGCVNAIRVYENDPKGGEPRQIDGLPFYAKTAVYKQDTIYEKYYFEVSLVKKEISNAGTLNEQFEETTYGSRLIGQGGKNELNVLKEKIIEAKSGAGDEEIIKLFLKLPIFSEDYFEETTTNNVEQIVVVDYDRKLYLNAPLPWFGSGKVSGEFNADGSLTKASSDVSTGLAEALSKLLPVKEFLQAKLVIPPTKRGELPKKIEMLTLIIEKKGKVYDFTVIHRNDPRSHDDSCPSQATCKLKPIPFDLINGNFTMKPMGSAKAEEPDNKKTNKIKISGDITMPKQSEKK